MDLLNNNDLDLNGDILASTTAGSHVAKLEQSVAELKYLCNSIDPYAPLTEKQKLILVKNGIVVDFENYDPFELTNKLILTLEDSLTELQNHGHQLSDF